MNWRRHYLAVSTLAFIATAASCTSDPSRNYTFSNAYTSTDSEQAIRTVAVPIFENTSLSQGMEILLTDAVIKEITRVTPWSIADERTADAALHGSISAVGLRELNADPTSGFVSEMAVDIRVDFDWVDNRTGQTLLARRNFRGAGAFAPGPGARETIELGEQGAVEQLARDIVHELLGDW